MNLARYTEKAQEAMLGAQQLAQRNGHPEVTPEHLLTALVTQPGGIVPAILGKMQLDAAAIGADRHSDRELSRPIYHGFRDQAVQSDRRHQQPQQCKKRQYHGDDPPLGQFKLDLLTEGSSEERQGTIDGSGNLSKLGGRRRHWPVRSREDGGLIKSKLSQPSQGPVQNRLPIGARPLDPNISRHSHDAAFERRARTRYH